MKTFETFAHPDGWATAADAFRADFQSDHRIQVAPWGGFAILGYEELVELSRNPAVDGMAPEEASMAATPNLYRLLIRAVFTKSGAEHRRERAALVAAFNTLNLAETVERAVSYGLPHSATDADVEVEIVRPIASRIWAMIVGFDGEVSDEFDTAVRDAAHMLSPYPDPTKAELSDCAAVTIKDLTLRALRRPTPFTDSLLTRVSEEAAADLIAGMAFDAIETATAGITAALRVAALHQDTLEPSPQCADECLRIASPTPMTMRQTTSAVAIGNMKISANTPLSMIWAAGNHDPRTFAEPEVFSLERQRLRPLMFGAGHHSCLGHAVIRATLQHLLQFVIARQPRFDGMASRWHPFAPSPSRLKIAF